MSTALPLVGLMLAAVAVFLGRRPPRSEGSADVLLQVAAVAAVLLIGCAAASKFAAAGERLPDCYGFVISAIACGLSGWLTRNSLGAALCGVAAACAAHSAPGISNTLIVGGLFVVAIAQGEARTRASIATYVATLLAAADALCRMGSRLDWASTQASVVGIGLVFAGALVLIVTPKPGLTKTAAVLVLLVGLSYLLGKIWIQQDATWLCLSLGSLAGVVIHWVMIDEEPGTLRTGMAGLIAVALGTASYGIGRGEGMALALIPAVGALVLLDNLRGLAATAPLAALVLYRVFRAGFPETARAFDIGQHYAVMGLLLGMLLPLLPTGGNSRRRLVIVVLPGLWSLALGGAVAASGLFFGTFGMIGVLVGSGFAPLISGLNANKGFGSLGLSAGVAGAVVLAYGWLGKTAEITREEKIHLLGSGVAVTLVLGVLIAFLSKESSPKETA